MRLLPHWYLLVWGSVTVTPGKRNRLEWFMHNALDVEKLTSAPVLRARKVALCSQSFTGAVNSTHRMGTFSFCAKVIQDFLVSGSAFVLSDYISSPVDTLRLWLGFRMPLPTTTLPPCWISAVAALIHFSRCFKRLLNTRRGCTGSPEITHSLQLILVDSFISKWLQAFRIVR